MELKKDPPFFLSLISATAHELKTKVNPSVEADALVSIDKFNQGTVRPGCKVHRLSRIS